MQDPRFSTHGNRADHIDEVYEFVADTLKTKTTAEWIALLDANDIPVTPLHDIQSLLDDPHLNDTGFFRLVDHPTEGRLRMTAGAGLVVGLAAVRAQPAAGPGRPHRASAARGRAAGKRHRAALRPTAAKPSRD